MSIRDLLWTCPHCGRFEGLGKGRGGWEVCSSCAAAFRRASGSSIEGRLPGQRRAVFRSAAEWAAGLPAPEAFFAEGDVLAESAAQLRLAGGLKPIRDGAGFLGRVERFGPPQPGRLRLERDRVVFQPETRGGTVWRFEDITGVQAASSALQIKATREPLAAFRFPASSARFWEEALRRTLRAFHRRRSGREVVEFQPRIVLL